MPLLPVRGRRILVRKPQCPCLLVSAAALPHVPGSPRLGVLRRLRPVPTRSVNGEPDPAPCWPHRSGVRTGTVPTFTDIRSTGEESHFVPAASSWLRRGHSP